MLSERCWRSNGVADIREANHGAAGGESIGEACVSTATCLEIDLGTLLINRLKSQDKWLREKQGRVS